MCQILLTFSQTAISNPQIVYKKMAIPVNTVYSSEMWADPQ